MKDLERWKKVWMLVDWFYFSEKTLSEKPSFWSCVQIQIQRHLFIYFELQLVGLISSVACELKISELAHAQWLVDSDPDPLRSTGELFGPPRPLEPQSTSSLKFKQKQISVLWKGPLVNWVNHSGAQDLQRSKTELSVSEIGSWAFWGVFWDTKPNKLGPPKILRSL